jgi:hypothetical protein
MAPSTCAAVEGKSSLGLPANTAKESEAELASTGGDQLRCYTDGIDAAHLEYIIRDLVAKAVHIHRHRRGEVCKHADDADCPGRKSPVWAVKRPAHPSVQNRRTKRIHDG